jgi:hypothetical protein
MSDATERRAHSRYALWFPVEIDAASGGAVAICRDASSGGILIESARRLEVGEAVVVSFRVTLDGELHKANGRIVRMEAVNENPRAVWSHRIAIAFDEPQVDLHGLFRSASSRPPPA